MPSILNEKTLVPVSLLIVIIGGIVWLTQIFTQSQANAIGIKELKQVVREEVSDIRGANVETNRAIVEQLRTMNTRLGRIEGKLEGY